MNQEIVLDGHVHIHSCFSLRMVLDSALKNLKFNARTSQPICCLLFTEAGNINVFSQLRNFAATDHNGLGNWSISLTQDSASIVAHKGVENLLYLFAGRQVVTREDIEVHAILTDASFRDGLPLHMTLQEIRAAGGLTVIPWGFGKWFGSRGRIIRRSLNDDIYQIDFMGDNGLRPTHCRQPAIFRQAISSSIPILPGSDAPPFAGHETRVGTAGLSVNGQFDPLMPCTSLNRILTQPWQSPRPFSNPPGLARFLILQLCMLYRKHRIFGRRSSAPMC